MTAKKTPELPPAPEVDFDWIKKMNIFQKIHAVSSAIGKVKMTLNVDTGKSTYKAISINDVVDSIVPLAEKYRIAIVPGEKEIIEAKQIVTTTKYGEKTQFYVRMKSTFIAVNIDNPSEMVKASGYGDGVDSGDKATGKANTYARKYALIDLFNISKGDDPDVEASQEYKKFTATGQQVSDIITLYTQEQIDKMLAHIGVKNLTDLTFEQAQKMIDHKALKVTDRSETY